MRESIGGVTTFNIVFIFMAVIFAFLAGTLGYMKAFKVNSIILSTIEKYEGYNSLSEQEINKNLGTLGYNTGQARCKERAGYTSVEKTDNTYYYCVYYKEIDTNHYRYGVSTSLFMDLPIVNRIRFDIFTETERIYKFS